MALNAAAGIHATQGCLIQMMRISSEDAPYAVFCGMPLEANVHAPMRNDCPYLIWMPKEFWSSGLKNAALRVVAASAHAWSLCMGLDSSCYLNLQMCSVWT